MFQLLPVIVVCGGRLGFSGGGGNWTGLQLSSIETTGPYFCHPAEGKRGMKGDEGTGQRHAGPNYIIIP